ncbi:hypothetical protein GCM10010191_56500 [Actinomadura vinacea]|uniref:DUF6286 domain-containing protein n=2 Tax=Actinomadura vinacea TaxID=115336 RepID=A0ABP5WW29_9ACTN
MGDTLVSGTSGGARARRRERRRARRLAAREFRSVQVTGLVAAPLLLAAGFIGTLEVVTALVGEPAGLVPADRWSAWLRESAWRDAPVRGAAAAVAGLGGLVLLALLPRRRPRTLPLRAADPLMAAVIGRRELQRSLAAAALAVPGIVRARARVRGGRFRRRVSVRAATYYRNPANLDELVRGAVASRLAEIDLLDPRRVHVRLKWRKD